MVLMNATQRAVADRAMERIGDGIHRYQREKRLTDADMARILGCSISTLRKIKDGESVKRSTEEVLWMIMLAGMWGDLK